MFTNPFSPIFGGKPEIFFGREGILRRFDLAMTDSGSEDRALFFTGTRGSGKTALLEQLSIRAKARQMAVFDLGPEDTVAQFVESLSGYDGVTTTTSPQASVSVMGFGGALSAGSVSKTRHLGRESMQSLLLEACEKSKHGLLVTIDEVQKVPADDVSALCNAFQMASRKGNDVMLAVAGLPYARLKIIEHEGCAYLRRASHEELGLFSWSVASQALVDAFARIGGLSVKPALIDKLNEASFGHPYLLQLLGYHLVTLVNENCAAKTHDVTKDEVDAAISTAVFAYERRALKPLMDELPSTEREYLRAMSNLLDSQRLASTEEVARALGRKQQSLSQARARLIGSGIIAAPERGRVMFCVPYLADYVLKEDDEVDATTEARKRRV
ncbi:MAG: ATP-binding protein [Eggerthellaceae bacterium]|nr:ATP-binding protein [Eggerthellaceae bacterium]